MGAFEQALQVTVLVQPVKASLRRRQESSSRRNRPSAHAESRCQQLNQWLRGFEVTVWVSTTAGEGEGVDGEVGNASQPDFESPP